jgi:hypothetical protein
MVSALPGVPPRYPGELLERIGSDILAKVDEQWASARRELGSCLVWREGQPTIKSAGGVYGRIYDATIGRSDAAHLVVWRRCFPDRPIPKGLTVDHLCNVTLCQRPDHLQGPVSRADNTRRARQRERSNVGPSTQTEVTQHFAVALFAGIDRPTVQPKMLTLAELVRLLNRFEVLQDKRRGRC